MGLRVMLVERSALVRNGLRRILDEEPDITVVAEASDGLEALQTLARQGVDVVVIGTTVDRDACRASAITSLLHAARIGIVCVSHWTDARDAEAALNAGALACVDMREARDVDLTNVVRLVSQGDRYVSPGLLAGNAVNGSSVHVDADRLTTREREVLVLIARGLSNREIARDLSLSSNTVAVHRTHIMKKVGVRKATALALFAAERGLIARR